MKMNENDIKLRCVGEREMAFAVTTYEYRIDLKHFIYLERKCEKKRNVKVK